MATVSRSPNKLTMKRDLKNIVKKLPFFYTVARSIYGVSRSIRRLASRENCFGPGDLVPFDGCFKHNFCGYYDHSPFMEGQESLILVHSTNASIYRAPNPKEAMCARVFDWSIGHEIERLGETYAWNWQQGSRLMWIGRNKWIFNIFDPQRNEYGSVTGEVGSSKRTFLPHPIQEISPFNFFYSINYAALSVIRPDYGYFNRRVRPSDFQSSGILEVSYSGGSHCIVSVQFLKEEVETRRSEQIRNYKINHLLCSPCGSKFVFLFRYFLKNSRRVTDVYLYKRENKSVELLISDAGVSHYCWLDDQRLVYTGIHHEQFGYYIVDINGERMGPLVGASADGHPVAMGDDILLTDTYPNRLGIRGLFFLACSTDCQQRNVVNVARFVEPWYLWGHRRCDLHPSVSPSGNLWQVDVVSQGRRGVCIGKV